MSRAEVYHIYNTSEELEPYIATVYPASQKSIEQVLTADVDDSDGRSQFVWVRLANGDLFLGVYPQGETYFAVEADAAIPEID
jgi:hypothetical protein